MGEFVGRSEAMVAASISCRCPCRTGDDLGDENRSVVVKALLNHLFWWFNLPILKRHETVCLVYQWFVHFKKIMGRKKLRGGLFFDHFRFLEVWRHCAVNRRSCLVSWENG